MIEAGTDKHTISMKLAKGSANGIWIFCGVVRDGAPCNEDHFHRDSTVGWSMGSSGGGLFGNGQGQDGDEEAGGIKLSQVLIMQVDMDAGTVKFWVNGKPYGPGYNSGVIGPLGWVTAVPWMGNTVEIVLVPTPALK